MPDIILKDRDFIALTCISSKTADLCGDINNLLSESNFKQKIIKFTQQESPLELPNQPYNGAVGFVLWEPKNIPGKSAFMATFRDGWDTLIYNLALTYKHECLKIRVSKSTAEYPICELNYYKDGIVKRFVRSMKDDPNWQFYQTGEPLSFEKVEYYQKRRIRDRFTEELLLEYLKNLGWNLNEKIFWETEEPYYRI